MKFFYTTAIILLFYSFNAQSILNAYAAVSSVSSGSVINVTNVDETNHTFSAGGKVVIMQMQDNVIGTNTTNASSFGNISTIANAGKYEIGYILSRSPAAGTPTTITLVTPLANTYNTGANTSVQIITFRNMGSNYTTTGNITGLAWTGTIGGVVAFEVTNTLTLNHNISANQIGFREGARSASAGGGCDPGTYITNSTARGYKGEGIYKVTDPNFTNGRGHPANGGGSGNEHNAGGAGGGNYTAGGDGGPGYGCGTPAGGLGGLALSTYISATRVFMGGGGGGGGQNNNYNSDGAKGGGIILIKASAIITNTNCSSISITANGGSASSVGNDGAGGGGAAGSIVLDVSSFSVMSACPMTVSASGGNGGDVTDGTVHAGGGGGGQGTIIYTIAQPTVNITSTTLSGSGGKNNSAGTSTASAGGGAVNSGVVPAASGSPLPVELKYFNGTPEKQSVKLSWETATEKNNASFIIEKSANGIDFSFLGRLAGAGNSMNARSYTLYDQQPYDEINYYRLVQTDHDGRSKIVGLIAVSLDEIAELAIFPNPVPAGDKITLLYNKSILTEDSEIELHDVAGKIVLKTPVYTSGNRNIKFDLSLQGLDKGVYFLQVKSGYTSLVKKVVID